MITNEEKILESMKSQPTEITVSELATRTNIDLSNISRYWKNLEKKGLIQSRTQQNGKIRTIYLTLSTTRKVIRKTIDKIFIFFFYDDFNPESIRDRIFQRNEVIHDRLKFDKLEFDKFSKKPGWIRTNFFTQKKHIFEWCYYSPCVIWNNKVIIWLILDLKRMNAYGYANINENYCYDNAIPPPKIFFKDTNFIPEDRVFTFDDIYETMKACIRTLCEEYNSMFKKFNLVSPLDNILSSMPERIRIKYFEEHDILEYITFYLASLEYDYELRDCNIASLNFNECRGNIDARFRSSNNTIHFRPIRKGFKHQLKVYEKTPTLLRIEYTLYKVNFMFDGYDLYLEGLKDDCDSEFNTKTLYQIAPPHIPLKKYAEMLKITDGDLLKLINNSQFMFNGEPKNQNLKYKLLRRKLIEKGSKRGHFIPSASLLALKTCLVAYISAFNFTDSNAYEDQILRNHQKAAYDEF